MVQREKILILMPALFVGGSELQVRYIIEGLAEARKKVVVLIENGNLNDEQSRRYIESHPNVKFIFLEQNTFKKSDKNLRNKIKALTCIYIWIIKNSLKENIKWVMFTNLTGLLAVPLCRICGIRVLFNERNPGIKMCNNFFKRFCLRLCTKIVANSQSAAHYMTLTLKREVECINNGIKIQGERKYTYLGNNTILVPARITKVKNQLLVIKALRLLNEFDNFKLLLVGQIEDENYYDMLCRYVSENDLEQEVFFTGYVSNMQDIYNQADLVILPSLEEGTPNVMLEAYRNQKLCLASDIVMNKNASCDDRILFSLNSPDKLAEKVRWILSLSSIQKEEMIEKNYQFVLENYSLAVMQERYVDIFN